MKCIIYRYKLHVAVCTRRLTGGGSSNSSKWQSTACYRATWGRGLVL